MRLLFLIATCERPEKLVQLLKQIEKQCQHSYDVIVINDTSESDYQEAKNLIQKMDGEYHRLDQRNGKRLYWKTVDQLFQRAKSYDFDYAFKLDDDIELHPSAIEHSLAYFNELKHRHSKVVLNLWVDHRATKSIWTNTHPNIIHIGPFVIRKVGWVDGGNWVANRNVFETLDWHCPEPLEKWFETDGDSSGVGKYLSVELSKTACRIFMPMNSLIFHGEHESVMHANKNNRPIEMNKKPWI